MKTVAVHLANGFEETEAITVIDVLRRAGLSVKTVSMTKEAIATGSHNIPVICDVMFEDVNYDEVDMIILPGGMPGAKNLDGHPGLKAQILRFDGQHKQLAAICAAPLVFGHLDILKNRRATCYPGFENELHGASVTNDEVVIDGHVTTSRGVGTALNFALTIVTKLVGPEKANQLSKAMLISTVN